MAWSVVAESPAALHHLFAVLSLGLEVHQVGLLVELLALLGGDGAYSPGDMRASPHRIMSRCPLTNHHSARFMHMNPPVNRSREMLDLFKSF
jgi:hypothetical protein